MSGISLKPKQRRRIAAEQAIYKKFPSFSACADACNVHAKRMGVDVTFSRLSIQCYVGCQNNFSMKRLKVLADLLNVTNYMELDQIFTAPLHRGEGDWWYSDAGNRIRDIDMTMMASK